MTLLDLIAPKRCLVCGENSHKLPICKWCQPLQQQTSCWRCDLCFNWIETSGPLCVLCQYQRLPFRQLRYLWEYSGEAKQLIRKMKYQPSYQLALHCADIAGTAFRQLYPTNNWDLILSIPSHPSNLRNRLFDISFQVARKLGTHLRVPTRQNWVVHKRDRPVQASLKAVKRVKNAKRSFVLRSHFSVTNKSVLLVDDVITSGSTVTVLTHKLLARGASSVDVFCLAQSPKFQGYRQIVNGAELEKSISLKK